MLKVISKDLRKLGLTKLKPIMDKYYNNEEDLTVEDINSLDKVISIFDYLAISFKHRWYVFNLDKVLQYDGFFFFDSEIIGVIELLYEQRRLNDSKKLRDEIIAENFSFNTRYNKDKYLAMLDRNIKAMSIGS